MTQPGPDTFVASVPERYGVNYPRYVARGGLMRPEDKSRFESGGHADDPAQFYVLSLVFDQVIREAVRGNLAHFGGQEGHAAPLLAAMARRTDRTLHVFGLAMADPVPASSPTEDAKPAKAASLTALRAQIEGENVVFHQGSLPKADILVADEALALVHVQCDDYLSLQSALDYVWPRMAPGGFLLIDGYSGLSWNGSEKAVDEFFADKPEAVVPFPDAAGTAAVRKNRAGGARSNWLANRKAVLEHDRWAGPQDGEFAELLEDGWDRLEPWGAWGLGERHSMRVHLPEPPRGDIEIIADCGAAIIGWRSEQLVDVGVSGRNLAVWRFTTDRNQMLRTVVVPRDLFVRTGGRWEASIDFAPRSVVKNHELVAALQDERELGLALCRIHQRVLGGEPGYVVNFDDQSRIAQYLESGWSSVEPWGVWGIGARHVLRLPDIATRLDGAVVEIEAQALMAGSRTKQDVSAFIGGVEVATLRFTQGKPDGRFMLPLPKGVGSSVEPVMVEFRPSSVASLKQLDPSASDIRPLGLGLRRLVVRSPG